jgi:hypothetical protein
VLAGDRGAAEESHVRNAIARFNQTESRARRPGKARRKLLAAARKFDIDVSNDSNVAEPVG